MGYKNTFQEYIKVNYKWEVEIERGRPVKNQNRPKGLSHKKIDAAMELVSRKKFWLVEFYRTAEAGEDCFETLKKRYFQPRQCYKSHLSHLLSTSYNSKTYS